jgi:hypothetical protein
LKRGNKKIAREWYNGRKEEGRKQAVKKKGSMEDRGK